MVLVPRARVSNSEAGAGTEEERDPRAAPHQRAASRCRAEQDSSAALVQRALPCANEEQHRRASRAGPQSEPTGANTRPKRVHGANLRRRESRKREQHGVMIRLAHRPRAVKQAGQDVRRAMLNLRTAGRQERQTRQARPRAGPSARRGCRAERPSVLEHRSGGEAVVAAPGRPTRAFSSFSSRWLPARTRTALIRQKNEHASNRCGSSAFLCKQSTVAQSLFQNRLGVQTMSPGISYASGLRG